VGLVGNLLRNCQFRERVPRETSVLPKGHSGTKGEGSMGNKIKDRIHTTREIPKKLNGGWAKRKKTRLRQKGYVHRILGKEPERGLGGGKVYGPPQKRGGGGGGEQKREGGCTKN